MCLKIIEMKFSRGGVGYNRVFPARHLDRPALDLAAKQFGFALNRIGKPQPFTGSPDSEYVANLGFNSDDVRQIVFLRNVWF